jgi:hypothetical protein
LVALIFPAVNEWGLVRTTITRPSDFVYSTCKIVDWIAAYDVTTDRCYYVPSWILGAEGLSDLRLRLTPARNGQLLRVRPAEDYLDPDFSRDPSVEPAGFEPAASTLQRSRSAN